MGAGPARERQAWLAGGIAEASFCSDSRHPGWRARFARLEGSDPGRAQRPLKAIRASYSECRALAPAEAGVTAGVGSEEGCTNLPHKTKRILLMEKSLPPRRQGELDYQREPSVYRNPYKNGSNGFDEYERGYFQAQRRDPNPPSQPTVRKILPTNVLGQPPKAPEKVLEPHLPTPSEHYRRRRDPG